LYAFVITGYGVFTTADISRGDFLLEYVGDEISPDEGDSLPDQTYVYYYDIGSKQFWYDVICCTSVALPLFILKPKFE